MRASGSYQLCQNRPSDSPVTHIIVAPVKTQIQLDTISVPFKSNLQQI